MIAVFVCQKLQIKQGMPLAWMEILKKHKTQRQSGSEITQNLRHSSLEFDFFSTKQHGFYFYMISDFPLKSESLNANTWIPFLVLCVFFHRRWANNGSAAPLLLSRHLHNPTYDSSWCLPLWRAAPCILFVAASHHCSASVYLRSYNHSFHCWTQWNRSVLLLFGYHKLSDLSGWKKRTQRRSCIKRNPRTRTRCLDCFLANSWLWREDTFGSAASADVTLREALWRGWGQRDIHASQCTTALSSATFTMLVCAKHNLSLMMKGLSEVWAQSGMGKQMI